MADPVLHKSIQKAAGAIVELLVCDALAPRCPSRRVEESVMEEQYREFCERILNHRLASIGELKRHRDRLATAMEQRRIDSSAFFELDLPVCYSNGEDARRMGRVFERAHSAVGRLAAAVGDGRAEGRKRRGRPPASEVQLREDRKIVEAWETGRYRGYADLACEMGMELREIHRAIDRHRKRQKALA